MLDPATIVFISLAYLMALFALAFIALKRAEVSPSGIITSPVVYTLSLAVYCTSWTFYGAVGSASRNGFEFLTIYLGPTIVFLAWWLILRKLVRISKTHRITSIADFISSRYGKSVRLAAIVTIMAVIGTTPYIALQLKAVATSYHVISSTEPSSLGAAFYADTGFWVAAAMGVFIVIFGTRNIGADEYHPGVVAAIAFESLVKLIALLAVGLYVTIYLTPDGVGSVFTALAQNPKLQNTFVLEENFGARWMTILILSGAAIICLPRQFQVSIVEISHERNLSTAAWLFPLYLLLISLFVIPIAIAGMTHLPAGSDPDFFVLTVPMSANQESLALLAFIGGFSSATSMMIVASIALSIMISNHLVMPTMLSFNLVGRRSGGDLSNSLLAIRRISIIVILFLGYVYYRYGARSDALASIGLMSFAAVAQFLPVIIGGIFWRNGTERGAIAGLVTGFSVWSYTLLLPTLERAGYISGFIDSGLFGISALRPEALFALTGWDPLVHAMFWSYLANIVSFVLVSLLTRPHALEQVQAALFVNAFAQRPNTPPALRRRTASVNDLITLTQRIIGRQQSQALFQDFAIRHGNIGTNQEASDTLIDAVERQLAGTVGAASARVMVSRVAVGDAVSVDEIIEILDEAQQVLEYSRRLEQKSAELEQTAAQLREANYQLQKLDKTKDDFLSMVSHELRTPMTSIRSFSEILRDAEDLGSDQKNRFLDIIVTESQRLTRLLDEILSPSRLETGYGSWRDELIEPGHVLSDAVESMRAIAQNAGVNIVEELGATTARITGDRDRLKQVFINLLSNAIKYNDNTKPTVRAITREEAGAFIAIIADNGPGFSESSKAHFETESPLRLQSARGSGLGLAISREIIERMNGKIELESNPHEGAALSISIPLTIKG